MKCDEINEYITIRDYKQYALFVNSTDKRMKQWFIINYEFDLLSISSTIIRERANRENSKYKSGSKYGFKNNLYLIVYPTGTYDIRVS